MCSGLSVVPYDIFDNELSCKLVTLCGFLSLLNGTEVQESYLIIEVGSRFDAYCLSLQGGRCLEFC
jgi:hypothetical protein